MTRPIVFALIALAALALFVVPPIVGWHAGTQVVAVSEDDPLRCAEPNGGFTDDGYFIVPLSSELDCEIVFTVTNHGVLPARLESIEIPWSGSEGSNMMHAATIDDVPTTDSDELHNDAYLEFAEPIDLGSGESHTFTVELEYIPGICTMQGGDDSGWQSPPGPKFTVSTWFGATTHDNYAGEHWGFAATNESSLCGPGHR